ncbi:hypothetical protein M404DRAFT_721671 [Pisolithus tinctorius Marx 270]|uniref:Uncharacterized protein n=1 Tax=Pisolithus tinctorius Marx 270 TaxID=870435 RepID=A0A0C3P324_PISTI|nr:hypothetical protein M404DRAFT_721671 [Pisolithus tinctorius Marx 270]
MLRDAATSAPVRVEVSRQGVKLIAWSGSSNCVAAGTCQLCELVLVAVCTSTALQATLSSLTLILQSNRTRKPHTNYPFLNG